MVVHVDIEINVFKKIKNKKISGFKILFLKPYKALSFLMCLDTN